MAAREWRENEKIKRKWKYNEEIERKWGENEEMERDSLSIFPLYPLSEFVAKCYTRHLCRECHKKTYHTRYEKIILGRIRCKKAPQVVPVC